jgi:hypothetical protein
MLMVGPQHMLLIAEDITDKPLQPSDRATLDAERHGLNMKIKDSLTCNDTAGRQSKIR